MPTKRNNLNKKPSESISLSEKDKSNFENTIKSLVTKKILDNLYTHNLGIWNSKKITKNRLGWTNYHKNILDIIEEGNKFVDALIKEEYKQVVLIGMGGSSQSAKVFNSFKTLKNKIYPELIILDSIHQKDVSDLLKRLDLKKTIFIISSKSGTTIETQFLFDYFEEVLSENDFEDLGSHFVAITDEGTPLNLLSIKKNFRHIFISQKDIGGRFSFSTHFGIIPALICGFDVEKNLEELNQYSELFKIDSTDNPILKLATLLLLSYEKGNRLLFISHITEMKYFATWLEQLIAESNGKEQKGMIPILLDYFTNSIKTNKSTDSQTPYIKYELLSSKKLFSEMFKWQLIVSVFCYLINIDPFNEPDVTHSKTLTLNVLNGNKQIKQRHPIPHENTIRKLFNQLNKTTPLAINVFLPESEILNRKLDIFSSLIRARTGCITFIGYGPRYLHSTGQIQKGGPENIHSLFLLEKNLKPTVPFKRKAQQKLLDLFFLQPEIDIISLKNLGRKVSILDFNDSYINQLNQLIKNLETI